MLQIFKGNLSSKLEKIWAQIHQGVFDVYCNNTSSSLRKGVKRDECDYNIDGQKRRKAYCL